MSKSFYTTRTFIICVTLGFLIFVFCFTLLILSVGLEIETNYINNALQATGIGLTAITIIFLAINYYQQQKEIKRLTQDSEFTRMLDITYRQIEISLRNLKLSKIELDFLEDEKNNPYYEKETYIREMCIIEPILRRLSEEINIYIQNIIQSRLKGDRQYRILSIVESNLYNKFCYLISHLEPYVEKDFEFIELRRFFNTFKLFQNLLESSFSEAYPLK